MPIANPSPYPADPLAAPFVLTFHPLLTPRSLVLHRLLLPPPTSLLHSIRPLLAARTRVSGEPPPLNHHARDRHVHRDIAISCVNHRHPPPPATERVVSSLVIVVCDVANLYYAALSARTALHDASRFRAITHGGKTRRGLPWLQVVPRGPRLTTSSELIARSSELFYFSSVANSPQEFHLRRNPVASRRINKGGRIL